jgi:hypothetical protein
MDDVERMSTSSMMVIGHSTVESHTQARVENVP